MSGGSFSGRRLWETAILTGIANFGLLSLCQSLFAARAPGLHLVGAGLTGAVSWVWAKAVRNRIDGRSD